MRSPVSAISPSRSRLSVTAPSGVSKVIDYKFWHVNHKNIIGLLIEGADPGAVPLKAKVTFVKKAPRAAGA